MTSRFTAKTAGKSLQDQLRRALVTGQAKAARELLAAGADPNGIDSYGDRPLLIPPQGRECHEVLLQAGADFEARGPDGRRAIETAWGRGWEVSVLALLEAGADPEIKWEELSVSAWVLRCGDGLSLFHQACKDGRLSAVELGLRSGCSIEARTARGSTPLMCAAMGGQEAALRKLIEAGAKIDAQRPDGCTAAMVAAISGEGACLKYLVSAGADLSHTDTMGATLADICANAKRSDLLAVMDWAALTAELGPEPVEAIKANAGGRMRL